MCLKDAPLRPARPAPTRRSAAPIRLPADFRQDPAPARGRRAHKAPELYAPLTGPHGWRFGPGLPLDIKAAHVPVWNAPQRPHLTKVGPVPFLCIFCWTRDVNDTAVVLPADDWAVLEALRIEA